MSKIHLWFAGTPEFAATSLEALIAHPDYVVDGVLTQPERPSGRGKKLHASAVKTVSLNAGIPIAQPEKLIQSDMPFAEMERPAVCIVAAYGLLLPQWFLDYPTHGCINIHASLLPRWRGAAPIQRAMLAGDRETGVGIMQMEKGLDTGPIWLEKRTTISGKDTAETLTQRLSNMGAEALIDALPIIISATKQPKPQAEDGIIYAQKLTKQEAKIDWQQPADVILRGIRAYNPFPVAFTTLDNENVRIHAAKLTTDDKQSEIPGTIIAHDKHGIVVSTADKNISITLLQLPGKKATDAGSLANGRNLQGKFFR